MDGALGIQRGLNAIQPVGAVKEEGGWRIRLLQNTPASFPGRPELAEQLTEELRRVLKEQAPAR